MPSKIPCQQEHRPQSDLSQEARRPDAEAAVPLQSWQQELLDERRQAYANDPDDVLSWDEIEANAKADLAGQQG